VGSAIDDQGIQEDIVIMNGSAELVHVAPAKQIKSLTRVEIQSRRIVRYVVIKWLHVPCLVPRLYPGEVH